MMKRNTLIIGLFIICLLANAQAASLNVKVFLTQDCSPCEKALDFLNSLKEEYPLTIEKLDVENTLNRILFQNLSGELGFPTVVPVIVIGDDYYAGFDSTETAGKNIRFMIDQASRRLPSGGNGQQGSNITLMVFSSPTCPHCAQLKSEFLPYIQEKYPDLNIGVYEVTEQESLNLLLRLSKELGFNPGSVPVTVVGEEYYIGYGSLGTSGRAIEEMVERAYAALQNNQNTGQAQTPRYSKSSGSIIHLPFLGDVNVGEMMGEMGIPLTTMVLGLLDGFNPCAFFVLTMLLSFLVYARSRKRMLLIGLTFVFVSGFVYFLFMTALFSAIAALNEIRIVALGGGIIALTIGIINLKDFFFFQKGISLTIPEDKKPKLYKRMRGLLKSQTLLELLVGTVVLAFVANSYELLCTAGIPLVYGNLLNTQQLGMMTSIMYIILYNIFYVMPLLAIVFVFVRSLGTRKMSKESGEILKAISGIMMLGFGALLIINPLVLSNIFVTGSLIGFAVIISLILAKLKKMHRGKTDEVKGEDTKSGGSKDEPSEGQKI